MAPWRARCIESYVGVHLHSTITIADLARVAQCGPWRFKRIFKDHFGCTPYQYVLRKRVERAQRLLMMSDDSLRQISSVCGFVDPIHLSNQFRAIVGEPPSTWRRANAMRLYD